MAVEVAFGVHLQIHFANGIVNEKFYHPLRRIDLRLERHLVVFGLLAALFELRFLDGIEILVKPAEYVVAAPDVVAAVGVGTDGVEGVDNLVELVGTRHQCVRILRIENRKLKILGYFIEVVFDER